MLIVVVIVVVVAVLLVLVVIKKGGREIHYCFKLFENVTAYMHAQNVEIVGGSYIQSYTPPHTHDARTRRRGSSGRMMKGERKWTRARG